MGLQVAARTLRRFDFRDRMTLAGLAILALGAGMFIVPLGFVVFGGGLFYLGLVWMPGTSGDSKPKAASK